ncbi:MAG: 1-deoxy-D-xylulose-5-phosphate reductoisomerase [Bacillota bacterium]|nr:1-deoxy-D-xylulose-5-phosphate reductoisomerase [Bacillota bacterium]
MRRVTILGSTGSIGTQALEVIAAYPEEFAVVGLAAGRRVELLAEQVRRYRPERVVVAGPEEAAALQALLGPETPTDTAWGEEALSAAAAAPAEVVLVAVVGARGLVPTLAALEAGRTVALANKESLVCGGELVHAALARGGGRLVPVDSEHSAIFQCLQGAAPGEVRRIILTASGGPFRGRRPDELREVTPEAALAHPTWRMGRRVTVDSATLMNKGLEVIEAHWLFGLAFDRIQVVIHPESIVHSLLELVDGSVLAQLGWPDMRLPIQYALLYPQRRPGERRPLNLAAVGQLTFAPVEWAAYPCLRLAVQAGAAGGSWPAVLNAADEVAVEAFLEGRLPFPEIASVVEAVLDRWGGGKAGTLEEVASADRWARRQAVEVIGQR